MADDAPPPDDPSTDDGPSLSDQVAADRAWADEKRKAKAQDKVVDLGAARDKRQAREGAKSLRDEVMNLTRVDVDRMVALDKEVERDELGFAWRPDPLGLPPHCPVTPLGRRGGVYYFLDPASQLIALQTGSFGQQQTDALFAPATSYLLTMWGAVSKGNRRRVQYETVRRDLMDACARRGIFDVNERLRGRGAWKDETGALVMHYGDCVVIGGRAEAPGLHGDYVYPAGPKLTAPSGDGGEDARNGAQTLLRAFEGFNWRRGAIDARLLLGWMIAARLGAAIDWRPQVMLTGDAGMGKTTLQQILKAVDGERLLDVADSTAAGLYQTLGHDALAVAFDEFENENEDKMAAVLRLARLASSGGKIARGGSDGVPSNYQARGAFLFSAINPPSLRPAEQSRTTILALGRPERGAKPPSLGPDAARRIGALLVARVIRMWPFWGERLAQYRAALGALGHSNRAQDQLGTLLAGADLALQDWEPHADEMIELLSPLTPALIGDAGAANWRRCLNHALGYQPDAFRAQADKSIGALLTRFYQQADDPPSPASMKRMLALAGLGLVKDAAEQKYWLGFPDRHAELARVYERTDWSARRGADGAWTNALTQAPPEIWRRERFRIGGGARETGVLIRLEHVLEAEAGFDGEPVQSQMEGL